MSTLIKKTIGEIRQIIREQWYTEKGQKDLMDDESIKKKSVLVPDEIKDEIKTWLTDMGLSGKKHKR